jgi:hypothetical protein
MRQSTYARTILRALARAGWTVTGHDVAEHDAAITTPAETMALLTNVDDLHVYVEHPTRGQSFLYFVWQGPDATTPDGEEILADYGEKLEALIVEAA